MTTFISFLADQGVGLDILGPFDPNPGNPSLAAFRHYPLTEDSA